MPQSVVVPRVALLRAFGEATVRRAEAYAAAGHVRDFALHPEPSGLRLVGSVSGNAPSPYAVTTRLRTDGGHLTVTSSCSCPVGHDCKHGAALLLVAGRDTRPQPQPAAWLRDLDGLLGELEKREPAGSGRVRLALQVDLKETPVRWQAGLDRSIRLRPVQEGKRGGWVKNGIGWYELTYLRHRAQHDPAQLAVLAELATTLGGAVYGNSLPDLATMTPSLWHLLGRLQEAGVELVPGLGVTGIEVLDAPVSLGADLRAEADDVRVELGIRHADRWWTGQDLQFLGRPTHGVALLRPEPPPGTRKSPHYHLTLAPLEQTIPDATLARLHTGAALVVPPTDREAFETEILPRLRRQLPTTSYDDSVALPAEVPPRLVLTVRWDSPSSVVATFSWHYEAGESGRRFRLDSSEGIRSLRHPEVERELLASLDAELDIVTRTLLCDDRGQLVAGHAWGGHDILAFVEHVLPALRESDHVDVEEAGVQPDYREAVGDPQIRFDLTEEEGAPSTDWLDLEVVVSVDGEQVPLPSVLAALTLGEELVFLPSGLHVRADHPAFAQLAELVAAAGQIVDQPRDRLRVSQHDLGLWGELAELGVVDDQAAAWVRSARTLRDFDRLPEVDPEGLKSELRGYQLAGFRWLAFLWEAQLGGVLADDMGLGKTLQALALITHARSRGAAPFLVVAPTSVVSAWQHQAADHAPGLVVRTVTSSAARRETTIAELAEGADIVVTSYTLFRLEAEAYAAQGWGGLVLDEAHVIKNHQGKTYQAVRKLDVPFRLAITGTPFENRLMELWALLSVVAPGLYPWPTKFRDLVVKPVEQQGDELALQRFRRRIRPFLLRRTKDLVAGDLPPKQEQVLEVSLGAKHRKVYDTHLQRERQTVLGLVADFDRNRIAIFSSLTRLRQLSLDAGLVDPAYDHLGSAKLDVLVEHLVELAAEGHRALVFSQFTSYLSRVRARLAEEGIEVAYLDGRTRNRDAVIEGFRTGDAPAFLISLKAGGVGLTLTEADYVFVLDPWWNPAVEAQAVDRTHRIGQTRPVMVYRLVATDTIEEKVMELKARKAELFAQVIDGDGAMSAGLGADDVRALFED
jgi:superfamily II DNA or RNA helicase